jgi:hypothetical protein
MIGTSLDVFFYKVYVDQQYIKEVRNSLKVVLIRERES